MLRMLQHDSQLCQLLSFFACWANGMAREDPCRHTLLSVSITPHEHMQYSLVVDANKLA